MERQIFDNVWDAIESDPAEAASLKARSSLLIAIEQIVAGRGLREAAAAKRLGVAPSRLKGLCRGKIDEFSLDELVRLAAVAGLSVTFEVVRTGT
jgi:predicted XRE-type DNA-binding protein